jgi:uncharacterized protein (TIGR03435 family)
VRSCITPSVRLLENYARTKPEQANIRMLDSVHSWRINVKFWRLKTVGLFLLVSATAAAQDLKPMAPTAKPVFEVATIKPSDPDDSGTGFQTRGRHVRVQNESITNMIMFAYGVHPKQIVGGPDWMKDRYDIDGVPDVEGLPSVRQQREMLQNLLADRFKLKFHREKRELAIYAIVPAKGGAKLTKTASDPDSLPDQTGNGNENQMTMRFRNNSMDDFADGLHYFVDKPVVNQTGLPGRFDFTLQWSSGMAPATGSEVPGMFTAMQEQLGLKLEATKAPVEVLVVDAVERPSQN